MSKHSITKATKEVHDWNVQHRVGCSVTVRKDNGDVLHTVTRSGAELLGGHTPVIWVEGISGCYDLARVSPAEGAQ